MRLLIESWRQRRLLSRAKSGDRDGFVALVGPELSGLHQTACYLARDESEARDLSQETLLRAYLRIGDFRAGAPLRPWLHRILRNLFLDRRKSAASRREVSIGEIDDETAVDGPLHDSDGGPLTEPTAAASSLDVLLAREQRDELVEHIRALPEAFQEALVLCDIQEFTYTEVTEITGLALGTVKSRLSRARLMLRKRLLATGEPFAKHVRIADRGVP